MKVNGYEVNVWHEWDASEELPCPIPDGYRYCLTLKCEEHFDEHICEGNAYTWNWEYHDGSSEGGNITHFKIVVDTPKTIIDDHLNPDNTKWEHCELSDDELDLIRVVSPAAYKEIGRLVDVIDEAS